MKISLKLQDHHQNHHEHNHHPPLLLRAKLPISIFNLPFLSHFSTSTNHPSDLSLSLATNFPSFPSLKLSYAAAPAPPLSLTLKSGTGLFGSPNNSPLVISAHFSFNPANPSNPNPTFSLFLKPQLGSFSLRKSTFSHPESIPRNDSSNAVAGCDPNSFGFVPLERPETMGKKGNDSILKGFQLTARTQMPVANRVGLNFRWWMSFSEDQMPVLRINKIGVHRVDDRLKAEQEEIKKKNEANAGEVEVLKGMCFWMKKELDVLTRVNREMKCELEEVKAGHFGGGDFKEGVHKMKAMPSVGTPSGGFKQWKNTRNRDGEIRKIDEKKKVNLGSDVETELQKAIEAANAAAAST
ncbi:hypothetical protein ACS0TY_026480 [Phlomoides rotata]